MLNTRAIGVLQIAAVAIGLALIAWLSPLPDRVTDRDVYEANRTWVRNFWGAVRMRRVLAAT